ncbi:MAG: hypothetical protein M9894_34020 [Planctomycetes bacterium]|nr:hypothetical protein [Planctomycetota bacterium]
MRPLALASLLLLALPLAARAQAPTAAVVLMVEDEPRPEAERIGLLLYGALLERGPYAERLHVRGRERADERLAEAIRAAASRHAIVDVVCAMHTIRRDPAAWRRLVPPAAARTLRLVYSSACHGAEEERAAWEALGARTVVTHVGINNPLVALPYVLSRWVAGDPIGPAVHVGWRESTLFVRMGLSLPGAPADLPYLDGSRPVVSGDFHLTVARGLGRAGRLPPELVYDRRRGGPAGLALRALAGRYAVRGRDALELLRLAELPLPLPPEQLRVEWLHVERPGRIVLRLPAPQRFPLERGARLLADREVRVWPGAWDPEARRVEVKIEGLRVAWGPLRARPTAAVLEPEPGRREGYRLRLRGRLGLLPVGLSVNVGGRDPAPAAIPPPLRPAPTPGLVGPIRG